MASSSGRDISRLRHSGSSSSLSELDEDWLTNKVPTRKQHASRCRSERKERLKPVINKQLVTTCIKGATCILPYVHLEGEKIDLSLQNTSTKESHLYEGYKSWHAGCQPDIASQYFEPIDQEEQILQKKSLCGDFSLGQLRQSKQMKSVTQLKDENANENQPARETFLTAKQLKIDRTPFQCPISNCGDFVCAAFFSSHLRIEHSGTLKEVISPGESRTILVDPRLNLTGINHCNIVYYMLTRLRNFGIQEFKNTIPILLMSSKIKFLELETGHRNEFDRAATTAQPHYMFWVTGITSESLRIQYSLEIDSQQRQCGRILSIGSSHDLRSVYQSGAGMIISQSRAEELTRRNDKLLEMQLMLS